MSVENTEVIEPDKAANEDEKLIINSKEDEVNEDCDESDEDDDDDDDSDDSDDDDGVDANDDDEVQIIAVLYFFLCAILG